MAKKGTSKYYSLMQEDAVATAYDGVRSKSSGAAVTDAGDVKVVADNTLFECKAKLGELVGQKPVASSLLKHFEKVADEAYETLKEPALALRFYSPDSILADKDGWVDLVVREMDDDSHRSWMLQRHREGKCP